MVLLTGDALSPTVLTSTFCLGRFGWNPCPAAEYEERRMMNVGYMLIPVVLFFGGIFVSTALFNVGMKRVLE